MRDVYYWTLYWIAGLAVVYYVFTTENKWAKDEKPSPASKHWIELQKLNEEYPIVMYFVAIFIWVLWPVNLLAQIWWSVKRLVAKDK